MLLRIGFANVVLWKREKIQVERRGLQLLEAHVDSCFKRSEKESILMVSPTNARIFTSSPLRPGLCSRCGVMRTVF